MTSPRIGAAALAFVLAAPVEPAGKPAPDPAFRRKLAKNEQILHALNRLAYGPRPGDPEKVGKLGLKRWIDRQLNPERIPESPELQARLGLLDSLRMDNHEIVETYPPPQVIVAYATGRRPLPSDPEKRSVIQRLTRRYHKRLEKKGIETAAPDTPDLGGLLTREQIRQLRGGTPDQRLAVLDSLSPGKLEQVVQALPPRVRGALIAASPEPLVRRLMFEAAPQQVLLHDLQNGKLYRSIYSERQLEEILTDFWFNHFNVFVEKGADRYLVTSYERDAIRPNVLGAFHDLLLATARHPAMLFYLDNWQSAAPGTGSGRGRARGLNENYARELLELHTLGVDGGYTQKDIVEVARCFTGWTIRDLNRGAQFEFNPKTHDTGEKTVLGVRIPPDGGIEDGLQVLEIFARHPSTARFVSRKLAQRFVADKPPERLVEAMAGAFRKSNGDLRAVMKAMLKSNEFWSEGAYRAKIKSPLELAASAVRAAGAEVSSASVLAARVSDLGQPLYRKMEPTGYSNTSEDWVSSAALLGRMNFAIALAANLLPGVKVDSTWWAGDPEQIARALLFRAPSPTTLDAIRAAGANVPALVLGSPDFQKR